MGKDIFQNLMKHLGKVGIGYPQIDDFLEVLKKILTPEEAEIAMGLPTHLPPFEVEEVDVIANRIGKRVDEVERILEKMSLRGLLYCKKTPSGKIGYAFVQKGHGLPQFLLWKGEVTDKVKEVAKPMYSYLRKGWVLRETPEDVHPFRYVPINQAADYTLQAVYSYDMMTEVVKKAKKIAVCHCPCRQAAHLLTGKKCTHSSEVCLKFNDMAEFVLERRLGREISKQEALDILRKSEQEGLIHFVDNCQEEIQHCCNCCSCCCWHVSNIKKKVVPRDYIVASYYLRTTNEEMCIGCGQCAEDCPLDVITMEKDIPRVDENICIGCGVCLVHCPSNAARLKKKNENVPFRDFKILHQTAIHVATGKDLNENKGEGK